MTIIKQLQCCNFAIIIVHLTFNCISYNNTLYIMTGKKYYTIIGINGKKIFNTLLLMKFDAQIIFTPNNEIDNRARNCGTTTVQYSTLLVLSLNCEGLLAHHLSQGLLAQSLVKGYLPHHLSRVTFPITCQGLLAPSLIKGYLPHHLSRVTCPITCQGLLAHHL